MKWKIVIVSIVAAMMLLFGGILYYASQKINEEELRKFMISSLESVFPHANVTVGGVDLKFGKSLNLAIEGLYLTLPEKDPSSQKNLFKINRVRIEIPFGVLLGLEQSITINLDGSLVNFVKLKGESNWSKAADKKEALSREKNSGGATAPTFLANGRIDLKFTDTRLKYNLEGQQKGEVLVKYFRVNNLGFNIHAAYELKSDISLKFSEQIMDMELSLVGQFSPNELIQQGLLKTKSILTVNKISFPRNDIIIPGFKTDIEFELSNTGSIKTKWAAKLNDKNRINALVKMRKGELSVEKIDVVIYLAELLDILKVDTPSLRVGDGKIDIKGDMFFGDRLRPDLTFSIGPQVKYNYKDMLFAGGLKGKYQGKTLIAGMNAKGLNGSLYGDFSVDIDIGKKPIVLAQLPPFKLSIRANDLIVPKNSIQNILYTKEKKVPIEIEEKEKKIILLPKGNVEFDFKNISLGGEPLSLEGGIVVANRELKSKKKIRLVTTKGGGFASFKNNFYREGSKVQFVFEMNNVDLKDVGVFFPRKMGSLEGLSFVNANGSFRNLSDDFTYDIALNFKVKNGNWDGLDLNTYNQNVVSELSKIPLLTNKIKGRKLKVSSKFQNISLKGMFANDRWRLERYSYISKDFKIQRGRGDIYPVSEKKTSLLAMDVDWSALQPVMLKNFSLKSLPLRLSGVGFDLKPDVTFVTKKLAKKHIEKRSRKLIKDLQDKGLENPIKDKKVKGILKGIL